MWVDGTTANVQKTTRWLHITARTMEAEATCLGQTFQRDHQQVKVDMSISKDMWIWDSPNGGLIMVVPMLKSEHHPTMEREDFVWVSGAACKMQLCMY